DVYCAVATAQMILSWHGINKSQEEIAREMRTGTDGTANDDQVRGYALLSNRSLAAELDLTASFSEATNEIHEGRRPFKSGIPGHARAATGWKTVDNSNEGSVNWVYILDPWPVGEGKEYWE